MENEQVEQVMREQPCRLEVIEAVLTVGVLGSGLGFRQ